jgi:hypothetical protein
MSEEIPAQSQLRVSSDRLRRYVPLKCHLHIYVMQRCWWAQTTQKDTPLARITFQKRQKEMKRQEKQRMKAEKRAQRKMAKNAESEVAEQGSSGPVPDSADKLTDSPVE